MIRSILTHPGGAHKDDLLAVCVLIAKHRAPVERREPSEADLDDPSVAVIDVGGRHEPLKSNYDHHHFPREHPPTCALSLVLADLGLYEDALRFCDWLAPAEWFDSRGPKRTAEWLGVPRDAIARLLSPIDVTLLRRFARTTLLEPGAPLYEVLGFVGQDLLDYLHAARAQVDAIAAQVERWSLPVDDGVVEALFLPRTEPLIEEPSNALKGYIRAQDLGDAIVALAYPDRRGVGYGLARYEDHPHMDFGRVESEADVHFAHKSGFVCKTSATDPERLKALLRAAWGKPG